MRQVNKMLIIMGILVFVFSMSSFASPSEWAEDSVFTLKYLGFLEGEIGDMTKLQDNITREEFAELALKMYLKSTDKKIEHLELGSSFEDTKNPYVGGAYNLGIVNGINKSTFAPKDHVTREQIAAMFLRELKIMGVDTSIRESSNYADYEYVSVWAKDGIDFISQEGIMKGIGDNKVAPQENATREQAMVLIHKIGIKYKWFGDFKVYASTKYDTTNGFTVPKRDITKMNIFAIDGEAYDLNIVLKGYTIDGSDLEIEEQHNQVYKMLTSNNNIGYKAVDQVMTFTKSAWNSYQKKYSLPSTLYIDIITGAVSYHEPTSPHIQLSANAVLNIRVELD